MKAHPEKETKSSSARCQGLAVVWTWQWFLLFGIKFPGTKDRPSEAKPLPDT